MLLRRESIGIDISEDAISITKDRIKNPIRTDSNLLKKGKEAYNQHDATISHVMSGIEYTPIQRNRGIDGLLKQSFRGSNVFFRVQRPDESLFEVIGLIKRAIKNKGNCTAVVICTQANPDWEDDYIDGVLIIKSAGLSLDRKLFNEPTSKKNMPKMHGSLFAYES